MKKYVLAALISSMFALSGCQRISTGEIGVKINMSKEIQQGELLPGSWNQTVTNTILTFPVKDISASLENKTPLTADNSTLADFDITVVYSINPGSVAELYSTKSKSFHYYDEKERDVVLMYNYMLTLINNAAYKSIRNYKSLEVADNREKIESEIRGLVTEQLKAEKLDTSLLLSVVQIRNIQPNAAILAAATEYVKSTNELRIKENEVNIARKEAERQKLLSENGPQTIAYMNASANMKIAEAVAAGKISAIIIPSSLTMLGDVKLK